MLILIQLKTYGKYTNTIYKFTSIQIYMRSIFYSYICLKMMSVIAVICYSLY